MIEKERFTSERTLAFLLYELFSCGEYALDSPFVEHTRGTVDLYLGFSLRFASELLRPADDEMDGDPVVLLEGKAVIHPAARIFREESGSGGWITAHLPASSGGLDMPMTVLGACYHVLACGSPSISLFTLNSLLVTQTLHDTVGNGQTSRLIPLLASGKWQGAVAMTESGAGSSLEDVRTMATPAGNGLYHITGHKVFVSCGGDPGAEGTVYLVLARTGDNSLPSMFAVPSHLDDTPNDVAVLSLDRMNGLHGVPFAQVTFGAKNRCTAYLMGREGEGLIYADRLRDRMAPYTGLFAGASAHRAFWKAWDYCQGRTQGRRPGDDRERSVEIVNHPAVRRLLLSSRTASEGILSLALAAWNFMDTAGQKGPDGELYRLKGEILAALAGSPSVWRARNAVMDAEAATGSFACLEESGFDRILRDIEGFTVHPRTREVAGSNLLVRMIFTDKGETLNDLLDDIRMTAEESLEDPELLRMASPLMSALVRAADVTSYLVELHDQGQVALALQDAALYMDILWLTVCGWMWLRQAVSAQAAIQERPNGRYARFYQGRLSSARYFFEYELPGINGLCDTILSGQGVPFLFFPDQYRL